MAQFTVRNIEESLKTRLKRRAVRHGTSLEDEVRHILRDAVKNEGRSKAGLGSRIAALFARIPLDRDLPEFKGQAVRLPDFGQ